MRKHKKVSLGEAVWYSGRMTTLRWIPLALLLAAGGTASAQQQHDAISRIFKHNNGQRTETQKMGGENKIREFVYDKNNILCGKREFNLDSKGQIISGHIEDGRKNKLGSTQNFFDQRTGQLLYENLYNRDGKLVRQLLYPGSLKDPKFAKRMVAFNYDPNNAAAPPKQVTGKVQPIAPVTKSEDEFEPGLPQGTAAPTAQEAMSRQGQGTPVSKPLPGRSFFRQKKS